MVLNILLCITLEALMQTRQKRIPLKKLRARHDTIRVAYRISLLSSEREQASESFDSASLESLLEQLALQNAFTELLQNNVVCEGGQASFPKGGGEGWCYGQSSLPVRYPPISDDNTSLKYTACQSHQVIIHILSTSPRRKKISTQKRAKQFAPALKNRTQVLIEMLP